MSKLARKTLAKGKFCQKENFVKYAKLFYYTVINKYSNSNGKE